MTLFHLNRMEAAIALSAFGDKAFDPDGVDHDEMVARARFHRKKFQRRGKRPDLSVPS
jgi:hypothetical protein